MTDFRRIIFPGIGLVYTPVMDGVVLESGYDAALEQGKIHDIPYMVGSTRDDITTSPDEAAKGNLGIVYEGCKKWGQALLKNGRAPAWLYYFTRRLPGDDAGAFYSSELWYTFGTCERCWRPFTEADAALSEQMVDCWTNFMKTGDPNGAGLPRREPYREDSDIRIFDI